MESVRVSVVRQTMIQEPMELVFDRICHFRRGGDDIWWAGLREYRVLSRIQRKLVSQFILCNFHLENREFTPHMTLAREVTLHESVDSGTVFGEPFFAMVDKISLMRSERINGILCYTELFSSSDV